jgi:hypothetical protein
MISPGSQAEASKPGALLKADNFVEGTRREMAIVCMLSWAVTGAVSLTIIGIGLGP